MALDDRTAQAQLPPEERRALLRAFADRMLLKITAMDDPEDMPGVERAVRVAAVIERVYSRCDRAERQIRVEAPALFRAEAECATQRREAIKARVALANTLEWEDKRRRDLGSWWDAAQSASQKTSQKTPAQVSAVPNAPVAAASERPDARPDTVANTATDTPTATYTDYTDDILEARADLVFRQRQAAAQTQPAPAEPTRSERVKKPPPPS